MQFLAVAITTLTLGLADAAPWAMTSWTGTACDSGAVGHWAVGPGTDSCITFANVLSLNVTSQGACTTFYYHDTTCSTSPFLANVGICDGFNGQPVGSFHINCTTTT